MKISLSISLLTDLNIYLEIFSCDWGLQAKIKIWWWLMETSHQTYSNLASDLCNMPKINLLNLTSSHIRLGYKIEMHVFFGYFMTQSWCEVFERFFMQYWHQLTQGNMIRSWWKIWINLMWGSHQLPSDWIFRLQSSITGIYFKIHIEVC